MKRRQVDIGALYAALEARREVQGRSWRDIAQEIGITPSTFSRLAQGKGTDLETYFALTQWLGVSSDDFLEGDKPAGQSEETMALIASHLRADRNLKPRSAEAIETVLRAAYAQLAEPRS